MVKRSRHINFSRYAIAATAATAVHEAAADFSGPYTVNPPPNGSYSNPASGTTFGSWTSTVTSLFSTTVDTSIAPDSLILFMSQTSVPNSKQFLDFTTTSVGSGLLSFDWSATLSD